MAPSPLQKLDATTSCRSAHLAAGTECRVESPPTAPAILLGFVERQISRLEHVIGGTAVPREDGNPEARGAPQLTVAVAERLGEPCQHLPAYQQGIVRLRQILEEDGELVAAEPGHGVGAATVADQATRHLAKEPVAGVMAQRVVDALEVVEVERDDGKRPAPPSGAAQRLLETLLEEPPFGRPVRAS